ncbi:MAG: FGGY-family carbohydrate kinase [Treponema sp.]|nr:FGGY-family carbohydrate kinase [Treponema sp.]
MLLTVDIGTSNFKAALWDFNGNRLAFESVHLKINMCDDLKHEINPSMWLKAFDECCKKITCNKEQKELNLVQAVVISGNGPSLVPVLGEPYIADNALNVPAENARLWLDARAVKYQNEVSEIMGGYVDAGFFLPKILHIKNDENNLYKKTKYFLGCPEYLAHALTGSAKSVFPCDGFDRWFWNDDVLEKLKMDKEKFPSFIRPGEKFGTLTPQAAKVYGFKENIPVISGGPDFFAAILGSGVTRPAQVCDRTGSSEGVNLCAESCINDKRLMSYGHPVKPYWNLSGIINTTGKAIEWGCDILGFPDFDEFISCAQKSGAGSGGIVFNPYLAGERAPLWNPSARALWQGISMSSNRNDFARSILEGIGFAIKDVISVMEESGVKAEQLRVTGGLAGCAALNQIKADIMQVPVLEGVYKEAELLGLAIIGACFLGKFACYEEASLAMCRIDKCYEPDLKKADVYGGLFEKYKRAGSAE